MFNFAQIAHSSAICCANSFNDKGYACVPRPID